MSTGPCFTDCGAIGETLPDEPPGTLPLCLSCRTSGVLPRVVGAARSDAYAATSSEFRPPKREDRLTETERLHFDEHYGTDRDGVRLMRQAPIAGGHDSAVTAHARTVARELSETQAQRTLLRAELGEVAIIARGLTTDELATMAKRTRPQLARQRMRAPR